LKKPAVSWKCFDRPAERRSEQERDMNMNKPVSKVLVLDDCPLHKEALKRFCDENNLVGVKVGKNRLQSVLRSNIDLGAILFAESYGGSPEASAEMAIRINAVRPELPIIMRRDEDPSLDGLPESLRRVICAAYVARDMAPLRKVIEEYIFSFDYPNALVRGIADMTQAILGDVFKDLAITCDTPYIVRDRIIFGEVFSLIPLESAWCRGYMMMQARRNHEPDLGLVQEPLRRRCGRLAAQPGAGAAAGESQAQVHLVRQRQSATVLHVLAEGPAVGPVGQAASTLCIQPQLVAGRLQGSHGRRRRDGRSRRTGSVLSLVKEKTCRKFWWWMIRARCATKWPAF
jgi:hypothetical protein